jgi:exopolysaccharide biosynthesis protein
LLLVWLLFLAVALPAGQAALGPAERIADGVLLYRLDDPALLDPPGPVAVQALRLDPRIVTLEIARATGTPSRETVEAIAARRTGVIAAVNAGFFSLQTGRPTGLLTIDGNVVSATSRPRGAVGIRRRGELTTLLFDQVSVAIRSKGRADFKPLRGSSSRDWARASYAIGGAGLLMLDGRELKAWTAERIAAGFDTTRHPRTLIGTAADGAIWLVTVDGRNLSLSLGMSFTELQRLSKRLGLRSVLNLDGGGSTTMWVAGKVVNHPSDPGGPRKVSDAILVLPRGR